MVKVHLEGIYGMKELIDGLTLGTGDSYATHIEDPQTNETALHQFVLGDDDARLLADIASDPYVRSDTIPVRDFVKVYAWVDAPLNWWWDLDHRMYYGSHRNADILMNGMGSQHMVCLSYACLSVILGLYSNGELQGPDWEDFVSWILTLPYQELLNISDESCKECQIPWEAN